jgi:hypothetical protein
VDQIVAKPFVFHACVVRHRFSVERRLSIDPESWKTGMAMEMPGPTYLVTRDILTSFEAKDCWKFLRHELN